MSVSGAIGRFVTFRSVYGIRYTGRIINFDYWSNIIVFGNVLMSVGTEAPVQFCDLLNLSRSEIRDLQYIDFGFVQAPPSINNFFQPYYPQDTSWTSTSLASSSMPGLSQGTGLLSMPSSMQFHYTYPASTSMPINNFQDLQYTDYGSAQTATSYPAWTGSLTVGNSHHNHRTPPLPQPPYTADPHHQFPPPPPRPPISQQPPYYSGHFQFQPSPAYPPPQHNPYPPRHQHQHFQNQFLIHSPPPPHHSYPPRPPQPLYTADIHHQFAPPPPRPPISQQPPSGRFQFQPPPAYPRPQHNPYPAHHQHQRFQNQFPIHPPPPPHHSYPPPQGNQELSNPNWGQPQGLNYQDGNSHTAPAGLPPSDAAGENSLTAPFVVEPPSPSLPPIAGANQSPLLPLLEDYEYFEDEDFIPHTTPAGLPPADAAGENSLTAPFVVEPPSPSLPPIAGATHSLLLPLLENNEIFEDEDFIPTTTPAGLPPSDAAGENSLTAPFVVEPPSPSLPPIASATESSVLPLLEDNEFFKDEDPMLQISFEVDGDGDFGVLREH